MSRILEDSIARPGSDVTNEKGAAEERAKWVRIIRAWSKQCVRWAAEAKTESVLTHHGARSSTLDDVADVIEANNEHPFEATPCAGDTGPELTDAELYRDAARIGGRLPRREAAKPVQQAFGHAPNGPAEITVPFVPRPADAQPATNASRWRRVLTIADCVDGELGSELATMAKAALAAINIIDGQFSLEDEVEFVLDYPESDWSSSTKLGGRLMQEVARLRAIVQRQDEDCACPCPCHSDVEDPGPHLATCAWADGSSPACLTCGKPARHYNTVWGYWCGKCHRRPAKAEPKPRCSVCGASRLVHDDGTPGVCSLVPHGDQRGCPDPMHDVRQETHERDRESPSTGSDGCGTITSQNEIARLEEREQAARKASVDHDEATERYDLYPEVTATVRAWLAGVMNSEDDEVSDAAETLFEMISRRTALSVSVETGKDSGK